jgi:hypothetical protein
VRNTWINLSAAFDSPLLIGEDIWKEINEFIFKGFIASLEKVKSLFSK